MRIAMSVFVLGFKIILLLMIVLRVLIAVSIPLHAETQIDHRQQPSITPTAESRPGVPQSDPLDPTSIYNNLLLSNLPSQSAEASQHSGRGPEVSSEVTNLANGGALTYPNVSKPQACVTFDALDKWASNVYADGRIQGSVWKDQYAGWSSFAVDDGGFYRASNVTLGYDKTVGNSVAAKIASTQPYAQGNCVLRGRGNYVGLT